MGGGHGSVHVKPQFLVESGVVRRAVVVRTGEAALGGLTESSR